MEKTKYPKYYIKRLPETDNCVRVWVIKSEKVVFCKLDDDPEFQLAKIDETAFVGNDYVKEIEESEAALVLSL